MDTNIYNKTVFPSNLLLQYELHENIQSTELTLTRTI